MQRIYLLRRGAAADVFSLERKGRPRRCCGAHSHMLTRQKLLRSGAQLGVCGGGNV